MRSILLVCATLAMLGTTLDSKPSASDLSLIEEFDACIKLRFELPPAQPTNLGMSRAAVPPSFGQHFVPQFETTRDFVPENNREKKALAALEAAPIQAGFYLFGSTVVDAPAGAPNYRALKGPAAITGGAQARVVSDRQQSGSVARRLAGLESNLSGGAESHEELCGRRVGF